VAFKEKDHVGKDEATDTTLIPPLTSKRINIFSIWELSQTDLKPKWESECLLSCTDKPRQKRVIMS
jgi:hypothetical protein